MPIERKVIFSFIKELAILTVVFTAEEAEEAKAGCALWERQMVA